MALYDGFFDAELNEDTFQYDREYNSGDFVEYFGASIGSGVCIYNNTSSMKVSWDGTAAVVAPGYLFIEGYWLKNDGYYSVPLSGAGTHAILAYLNTGARRIEIISQLKADPEEYPNCLCLAYVTLDAGTVEDTRYNTDICGVIDSAGDLSNKVEYAINYIDNEVEGKLAEAEAAIEAQALLLDEKIAEVNAQVEKLAPDPIGTVKFSATSAIEEGWLRCDGSFISETDYPELVAALGKKTPGVKEFNQIVTGTYQGEFSNAYLVGDTYWVYHITGQQLIGFSSDGTTKTKAVEGVPTLIPSLDLPVVLSIVDDRVFISQSTTAGPRIVMYQALNFEATEQLAFSSLDFNGHYDLLSEPITSTYKAYPEVVKTTCSITDKVGGTGSTLSEAFAVTVGYYNYKYSDSSDYLYQAYAVCYFWSGSETMDGANQSLQVCNAYSSASRESQLQYTNKFRFSRHNSNEMFVLFIEDAKTGSTKKALTKSLCNGLFNSASSVSVTLGEIPVTTNVENPTVYNNQFVARVAIENKMASILSGTLSPTTVVANTFQLPVSNTTMFMDSVFCVKSQMLWLVFVGSGIMFSRDLANGVWGYLDTSAVLGVVTQYGCIEYDETNQQLFIAGKNSTGKYVVGVMKFPNWYDYANDGAFLPMIASDGVPAYIKAFEPEEGA